MGLLSGPTDGDVVLALVRPSLINSISIEISALDRDVIAITLTVAVSVSMAVPAASRLLMLRVALDVLAMLLIGSRREPFRDQGAACLCFIRVEDVCLIHSLMKLFLSNLYFC